MKIRHKFNSTKSQVVCFGSRVRNNTFCDICLNGSAVAVVINVKYLGV